MINSQETACPAYGELKRTFEFLRNRVARPCMDNHLAQGPTLHVFAHVSSLCAILPLFLKKRQDSAKAIAPMLTVGGTRAIYYDSPLRPVLAALANLFDDVCWSWSAEVP